MKPAPQSYKWLPLCAGITLIIGLLASLFWASPQSQERKRAADQARKDAMVGKQRAEEQAAFEASPAGKKEKAAAEKAKAEREKALLDAAAKENGAREKAQLNADAQKAAHYLLARSLESSFLDHGIDVKCEVAENNLTLMIVGEPVNRVFVHQFMRSPTIKSLRSAGLKAISFWNGHQLTDIYTEKYDITR